MNEQKIVKGFKVFNSDWTCRGFQYTCPGTFEEDVTLGVCNRGFHFCTKANDCFNYYSFDPANKVAEVIALGDVLSDETKSCTNKIQIVREIPWTELLEIVNIGKRCDGFGNSGDFNNGNFNCGKRNNGNFNCGYYNNGEWNGGYCNNGNYNCGDYNNGKCNSGAYNNGNFNSGDFNNGNFNSGSFNRGKWNSGEYNATSFSAGCFCTEEPKILMFNKPSCWTMTDWMFSRARAILKGMPQLGFIDEYVSFNNMTEQEKAYYPESEITGGYLRIENDPECGQIWWDNLSDDKQDVIKSIPNFDKVIFKEITGIDVD